MSPSEHRKSDATCNLLTHRLAGVALRIYLGLHGLVGWGGLELGDISPLADSELALGDFEIIRSVLPAPTLADSMICLIHHFH